MELPDTAVVRRTSVVLVMAAELGVQGFLLLFHRIVPMPFAPVPDCLQSSAEPCGNRLHVHCELPLSAAGAYVHKAQEIEGCRFLSLLPRVLGCISPEFQQPRLLRVQCQTLFLESLRQDTQHLFCVLLVLEAQDGIISKADLVGFPFQPGLHFVLEPFVENVVQEYIGQERTDGLPLSCTCFAHEESAVFDDSDLDSFCDEAE